MVKDAKWGLSISGWNIDATQFAITKHYDLDKSPENTYLRKKRVKIPHTRRNGMIGFNTHFQDMCNSEPIPQKLLNFYSYW